MSLISSLKSNSIDELILKLRSRNKKKKLIQKRQSLIQTYLSENETIKLHIGCGPFGIDGWLNTDLTPLRDEVVFLDAGELFPLKDNQVDFVYSEHLFEHLNFRQAVNMLNESKRVLKNGGVIRIATPNLDFLNRLSSDTSGVYGEYTREAFKSQWNLKDARDHFSPEELNPVYVVNNFFKDWGHQIIHNYSSLEQLLLKAGFSKVAKVEVGKSEFPELQNIEQHHRQIGEKFNLLETLVVEAIK